MTPLGSALCPNDGQWASRKASSSLMRRASPSSQRSTSPPQSSARVCQPLSDKSFLRLRVKSPAARWQRASIAPMVRHCAGEGSSMERPGTNPMSAAVRPHKECSKFPCRSAIGRAAGKPASAKCSISARKKGRSSTFTRFS